MVWEDLTQGEQMACDHAYSELAASKTEGGRQYFGPHAYKAGWLACHTWLVELLEVVLGK